MGRKPNTELRRQQIIDALLVEMASVGFERASTKSIADRAELASGLVHYHFKSKEEILLALVDQLIEQADQRYLVLSEGVDSAPRRLAAFVSARVGLGPDGADEQVRAWVNIIAEAMGQARVRERVSRWLAGSHKDLAKLFADAGASQPKEQASLLLAMILGSFSLHAIQVAGVPRGYAERQVLQWLRGVVTGSDL